MSGDKYAASPQTLALRPPIPFDNRQQNLMRRLFKDGTSIEKIADYFDTDVYTVQLVLSTSRTPIENHDRRTLNVSVAAHRQVMSELVAKEYSNVIETMDAMLDELNRLRIATRQNFS